MEKVVLASKSLFRPANGMGSTRSLVEIHNTDLRLTKSFIIYFQQNFLGGAIGDCTGDSFVLSAPGGKGSPAICGLNTGQHSKESFINRQSPIFFITQ